MNSHCPFCGAPRTTDGFTRLGVTIMCIGSVVIGFMIHVLVVIW